MKHFSFSMPRRAARLGLRLRRAWTQPSRTTSVHEEMFQGALVGWFASLGLTLFLASGPVSAALLAFWSSIGFFAGGVIGMLLWIGSADLPEDPVLSPDPGQARAKSQRRP